MSPFRERARAFGRRLVTRMRDAIEPPALPANASPLEVQYAIVEAIESRVQPIGGGRRLPRDPSVRVRVVALDDNDHEALKVTLGQLNELVMNRLRAVKCDLPSGWRVDVSILRKRPAGWQEGQRFALEAQPAVTTTTTTAAAVPSLKVTILRGSATKPSYQLRKEVIRIGRSPEPVDDRGRPRHNDVVFLDDDDQVNVTVGRGHCHLRFHEASGSFRVFDDKSSNGTRILRRGEVIDVRGGDPNGVILLDGDELHLGRAAIRLAIG